MRVAKLREAGPFEIETFTKLKPAEGCNRYGSYFQAQVVTAYADTDQPSHCVRLWTWED